MKEYSEQFRFTMSTDERLLLEQIATDKGVSMGAVLRAGIALMSGSDRGTRFRSRRDRKE